MNFRIIRSIKNILCLLLGVFFFLITMIEGAPNVFVKNLAHQHLEPDLNIGTAITCLISIVLLGIVLIDIFKSVPSLNKKQKPSDFLCDQKELKPFDKDI